MSLLLRLAARLPTVYIQGFANLRGRAPWIKRATDWIPNLLRGHEGTIQRGVGRGLRFDGGNSATGFILGTHDPAIQTALAKLIRPGMTVYDVGANNGFVSIIAARLVTMSGQVIAFEPQPECSKLVQRNADLNSFRHIKVRTEALGNSNGVVDFVIDRNSTFSRFADIEGSASGGETIQVEVHSLDHLVSVEEVPKPDVIKIDVEGAESRVLRGSWRTIHESGPILLIELHGTNREVETFLQEVGYESFVIGEAAPLEKAHWNALVAAVPKTRTDLRPLLTKLQHPSVLEVQ